MTDKESPDEEIKQAIQKSIENVEQVALTIRGIPAGDEDVWYPATSISKERLYLIFSDKELPYFILQIAA